MHAEEALTLIRLPGGVLAAMLPARWWPWLDQYVPATRMALLSSVVTVIAAGMAGIAGFVGFAQRQASAIDDAVLNSPAAAAAGDDLSTFALQGVSALSVAAFFLTPAGIIAAYFTLSGIGRALSATLAEGSGDPLLTALDAAARRLSRAVATRHRGRSRETLEGPAVADQVFRGAHLGIDADFVIVCARRKADWDQGTIVHSGDQWYRVGTIEERTIRGLLRTLYPLREVKDHGVFRRQVEYEIPARFTGR